MTGFAAGTMCRPRLLRSRGYALDYHRRRSRACGIARGNPSQIADQSAKGSRTRIVSSRSGLVDTSATGQRISSSTRRMYLIACAGRSAQLRAPAVVSVQPAHGLVDRLDRCLIGGVRRESNRASRHTADSRCRSAPHRSRRARRVLVSAMPVMPPTATDWRTSTASNQPQRRLRPVTVPNSWPRVPSRSPVSPRSLRQLGRERAGADARGIGLGDAEHEADSRTGRAPIRPPPRRRWCWTR